MDALEQLRRGLAVPEPVLDPAWVTPTQRLLEQNLSHIQAWVRGEGFGHDAPAEDVVIVALKEFWQRQRFSTGRHARYVCYGCAREFGQQRLRLIEDATRFPKALEGLSAYLPQPRRFRRCYQGLLQSYLLYDPETAARPAGKSNWQLLRTYLAEHVHAIRVADTPQPTWVDAAGAHQHLFTDTACLAFASRALQGDTRPFEDMRVALEIAQRTWVTRRFVLSQVETASRDGDREFRARIPYLLQLLAKYDDYADDGLAMVLERYCRGAAVEANVALRDFAVLRWRNPWLEANRRYWHDRVSARVRETVASWLKLKLMRDFFSLLADERANDQRRLDFWLRYIDRIDDMYFALGNDAMFNQSSDFVQLRNEMKGRLLRLHRGGLPTNNAFLMSIGGHYVVEFGDKNNACFVFDKALPLPFDLTRDVVAGDGSELKHESRAWRLLHKDRSIHTWEEQFASELSRVLGEAPGSAGRRPAAPRAPSVDGPRAQGTSVKHSVRPFPELEFVRWRFEHRIDVQDQRGRGGALWVKLPREAGRHSKLLEEWGFRFNESRNAWWKDSQ